MPGSCLIDRKRVAGTSSETKPRDHDLFSFGDHLGTWKTVNEAMGPKVDLHLGDFPFCDLAVAREIQEASWDCRAWTTGSAGTGRRG